MWFIVWANYGYEGWSPVAIESDFGDAAMAWKEAGDGAIITSYEPMTVRRDSRHQCDLTRKTINEMIDLIERRKTPRIERKGDK